MLLLITISFILLSVNGQDDNKFNIKYIENYNSTKGLFLPWLKVCSDNVNQIDTSILVHLVAISHRRQVIVTYARASTNVHTTFTHVHTQPICI